MIFGALRFIAQTILDQAEGELYDETAVHQEMSEAYALLESGSITDEEFDRREEGLLSRLEMIEARRGLRDDSEDDDGEVAS